MFQSVYDSPWTTTALVAVVAAVAFALWIRRRSFLVAYMALFTLEILLDALRAGSWSPLHLLSCPLDNQIGMGFVLLGDFRYFLLIERFAFGPRSKPRDVTAPRAWGMATLWTVIVPLISLGLLHAFPARFDGTRWSFLAYELMLLVLLAALRLRSIPRRLAAAPAAVQSWLLRLTHFEMVQYALWALADVIILCGVDAGFALRLVPNFMYYALFLPLVGFGAPAELDG